MEKEDEENLIIISDHAFQRAKERLSLKKAPFTKLARNAYLNGLKHSDTKGNLNKFISKLWFRHKNADNVRIYGEHLFLFKQNVLLTVFILPSNLKNHAKNCKS